MSINRINLAHIQDIPLKQGELTALVELGGAIALPGDLSSIDEVFGIWQKVQEQRLEKGLPPNDDLPRYFLNRAEGNRLFLSLGSYSLFIAANEKFLAHRNDGTLTEALLQDYLSTGYSILGLSAVVTSAEGAILLQKRSGAVTQGPGTYMPPAGGFMPNHYGIPGDLLAPDPFVSAHRQLFSAPKINVELFYIGLSSDTLVSPNPTLTFYGATGLNMAKLEEKWRQAKGSYEPEFIRFISEEPEKLLRTIRGEVTDFSGSPMEDVQLPGVAIGALILYGRAIFGNDWFNQSLREAVKNEKTGIDSVSVNYSR